MFPDPTPNENSHFPPGINGKLKCITWPEGESVPHPVPASATVSSRFGGNGRFSGGKKIANKVKFEKNKIRVRKKIMYALALQSRAVTPNKNAINSVPCC